MSEVNVQQMWQEIVNINNKIDAEEQKGSEGNPNLLDQWRQEVKDLEEIIKATEQATRDQKIEEKAAEVITFNVPGVDMKNLPPEVIQLVDIFIRHDRKRIYAEEMAKADKLSADHKEELRAAAERETNLKFQNGEMQKTIEYGTAANESLINENGNLRDHSYKINAEKSDLETRLRNAAAQIEEQQTEIERLNNKVFEYQEAKVNGVKEKNIIDVPAESVTDVQGLVDAIAKKYIASNPIGGNWHELVAEDGSKEVVHARDLPSIQQESPSSDTISTESTSNQLPATYEAAPVEVPQFQTIQAPPLGLPMVVSAPSNSGESDQTPVTRTEFKSLEERIVKLETDNRILTANWPKSGEVA